MGIKNVLERIVDEVIALIIVATTAVVTTGLAATGNIEVLKAFFTYFTAPLAVPIISYYFGQRTARKAVEEAKG